jgi:hypothetical protein
MANEIRYYDTPFTFISPVRHFKANDPYYYEVDNIPIKQLEESQKFLKDQVDGIIARQNNKKDIEIDRSGFSELKPYVTGNDRKVRVKPGKFTARINNAYDLTPLQVVEQITGFSNARNSDGTISDLNTWRVDTNIGTSVQAALDEFQQGLQGDALNMNGLAERAFVFPIDDEDGISHPNGPELLDVSAPGYSQFDSELGPDDRPLYPNYIGAILKYNTVDTTRDLTLIKNVYTPGETPFGGQQGRIESEFIKRWRGAIRTSVVDVAEELEITVPDFDGGDFFYFDANGNQQPLNANQRIDLLFIYSKAVDEESTTIPKFDSNGNPTTLTKPALGILKGAGIGMSRTTATNNDLADDRVSLQTLDGTPIMLAHPGDENGTNNGFTTSAGVIRGSFPSPDDLMNLAPVLSENLETTSFALIGQSILPIAYVRVQTAAGPIADLITEEDIIDIRPFFRTTELAYNERAGIAAATPQISIANPVVTEAHLEKVRKEVFGTLQDQIDNLTVSATAAAAPVATPTGDSSRIIAAGSVVGGWFGPEGALMRHANPNVGGGVASFNFNSLTDLVEEEFSYPAGSIGYLPNWDKADWYGAGGYTGDRINDSINVGLGWCTTFDGAGGYSKANFLPPALKGFSERTIEEMIAAYGGTSEGIPLKGWGGQDGNYNSTAGLGTNQTTFAAYGLRSQDLAEIDKGKMVQIHFVRKRIKLNLNDTPWVSDYHVNVDLLNCIPLSMARSGGRGQSANVWVNKYKDHFVINVAWVTRSWDNIQSGNYYKPWGNRNNSLAFAGFTLPEVPIIGSSPFRRRNANYINFPGNVSNQAERVNFFNKIVNKGVATSNSAYAEASYLTAMHPLLYPSVTFEVIGLTEPVVSAGNGGNGALMRTKDPTIVCK